MTNKDASIHREKEKENRDSEIEDKEGIHAPGNKKIPLFDMRLRKLEVPIFKEVRQNPDGWFASGRALFSGKSAVRKDKLVVVRNSIVSSDLANEANRYARFMRLQQESSSTREYH